jgi:transitional endoplasmic reticulum ATPase
MPKKADRKEIFKVHLRGKPVVSSVDPDELAARTKGFSSAQIASICNRAALTAVRRAVKAKNNPKKKTAPVTLTHEDIDKAIEQVAATKELTQ